MNILLNIEEKNLKVNALVCWGRYIKAKRLLEEILEEEPACAAAHCELGKIYCNQLLNYRLAEYHFKLAIQFEPEFVFTYYAYQRQLFQQSRYAELQMFSEKALLVKSIYKAEIYKMMGVGSEENLKLRKAKEYYEKALKLAIHDWEATQLQNMLERVEKKRGKKKKNKKALKNKTGIKK